VGREDREESWVARILQQQELHDATGLARDASGTSVYSGAVSAARWCPLPFFSARLKKSARD